MRTTKLIWHMIALSSGVVGINASPSGTLSGFVVDDSGAPIASATVMYRSVQTIKKTATGEQIQTGPAVS
jgi:hypothetical protein